VVDARSGPGIKSMVKSKKQKDTSTPNTKDENYETPEKINKKHFYRSKKKPAIVRKRNPSIPVSGFLDMSRWTKEKVCCGVIFRGPHGEVAIDPRFLHPCTACKSIKEPLTPLPTSNNNNSSSKQTADHDLEDMETDDSASISSGNEVASPMTSLRSASSNTSKLIDEADDVGFLDKAVVSPSESGTSTPPPPSDPETLLSQDDTFLSQQMLNAT
jgi:hypothetical protein